MLLPAIDKARFGLDDALLGFLCLLVLDLDRFLLDLFLTNSSLVSEVLTRLVAVLPISHTLILYSGEGITKYSWQQLNLPEFTD